MDMTSVFAEITKTAPQDDGSLFVFGKATGSDLDLDQQRCDPDWLKRAMPDWFSGSHGYGGNIREQHDAKRAIGKATDHEIREDGHYIRAHIVDPVAVAKTKAGIFSGFSIGIQKPRLEKADGQEWIRDGSICEISLVDRPALPTATFTMCKAAKPGMQVKATDFDSTRMLVKCEELTVEPDIEKSADVDTVTLSAGEAPVEVEETKSVEAMEAVVSAGHEGLEEHSPSKAFSEIGQDVPGGIAKGIAPTEPEFDVEQAKALVAAVAGKSGEEAAKAVGEVLNKADADVPPQYDDEQSDVLNAQAAISIIGKLIVSEASELVDNPAEACDIELLLQAIAALRCFIVREQQQSLGENDVHHGPDVILMAAEADVEKAKYSADDLRDMLKSGKAFKNPDGEPSYPIGDKDDLSKAIKAVGRGSGDHDSIRAYIVRRAKALGASDMIPEDWSSSGSNKAAEPTLVVDGDASGAIESLNQTSDELKSVEKTITVTGDANKGAGDFLRYLIDALTQVADEGEPVLDKNFEPDLVKRFDEKTVAYGVATLIKALATSVEKPGSTLNKSVKAVVETATESTAKSVSDLMERLEKVESMATPGGPALRRTEVERAQSRKSELTREVMRFKALSNSAVDNDLRRGYAAKAAQLETEAKAL